MIRLNIPFPYYVLISAVLVDEIGDNYLTEPRRGTITPYTQEVRLPLRSAQIFGVYPPKLSKDTSLFDGNLRDSGLELLLKK